MKTFLISLCFLFASCSNSNGTSLDEPVILKGVASGYAYFVPNGGQAQSATIDLQDPLIVSGFQKPITRVELVLPEHEFITWRLHLGKPIVVSCSLKESSLWGYKNVACSPDKIEVVP